MSRFYAVERPLVERCRCECHGHDHRHPADYDNDLCVGCVDHFYSDERIPRHDGCPFCPTPARRS